MIRGRVRFVERLTTVRRIIVAHRGLDADGVPLVTVADVLEIVETWTGAVCEVLGVRGSINAVAPHWVAFAAGARVLAAQRAADDYHPDRRGVFAMLKRLAVVVDEVDTGRLADQLAAGWRNAEVTARDGALDIVDVKDWMDLLSALARHLRDTHGAVTEANPSPGRAPRQYPRTTVAEVLAIADFWAQRLTELGGRRGADADAAIAAWRRAVTDMTNTVKGLQPDDTYPKDWEFWDALYAFVGVIDRARTVAVEPTWHVRLGAPVGAPASASDESGGPPNFIQAAVHSVVQGVEDAASAAMRSVQGAVQGLAHGVGDAATGAVQSVVQDVESAARSAVQSAAKDIAVDAAAEAKRALARAVKPVAIGGAVVLGALVLIPALTRR